MASMAKSFADALQRTEETRDPEHLVSLFAPDAELHNLTQDESGQDGVRRFWARYLEQFEEIHSSFSRMIETDSEVALVWTSEGRLHGGHPIDYAGVSILEFADGKVRRFETYYDSAAFLRPEVDTTDKSA